MTDPFGAVLHGLADPLSFGFMLRGMLAVTLVGFVAAIVGTFVVLRGMAFFGDALSHAILPGLAIGYLVSGPGDALFWWGLGTGIVTALIVGVLTRRAGVREDTAIGITFAGMFALGIALISSRSGYAVDLTHLLFGDVLGVSKSDLGLMALLGGAVVIAVLALYKELVILAFDPVLARTLRLPVDGLYYLLLVLIAVSIMVALRTVGIALMVALLVTPAAAASVLTRRLPAMMAMAAAFGALSGVAGLYLSYYVRVASGAAIVLVATALFALAAVYGRRRGRHATIE